MAGSFLLLGTLLATGGCGYKNQPVPPESIVPKPVEDLRYTVDEKGVTLTWSYPVETIRGTDVVDVSSFELYRAVVPIEEYCAGCPIPFGEPITLPGGESGQEVRRKAEYKSALLRSKHKYFYKVRSRTSWWASSDDSNIVSFIWHIPAKPPQNVAAAAKGDEIVISWQPVTELLDGSQIDIPVEYQVLRSVGGQGFEPLGAAVSGTSLVDSQVVTDQKYFYKVQTLLSVMENKVGSGVSEVASAIPVDTTPPPAPVGVTAVETDSGIKIFWDASSESDVGGYRIYRRSSDQDEVSQIGEVQAAYTLFVDKTARDDVRYYYSVTTIDQAEPANESMQSREATLGY